MARAEQVYFGGAVVVYLAALALCLQAYPYASARPNPELNATEFESLDVFQAMLEGFAESHNYSREYDCTNYSMDLVSELNEQGYAAYFAQGINPGTGKGHAWVRVVLDIEPQGGMIVDNYGGLYPDERETWQCADWETVRLDLQTTTGSANEGRAKEQDNMKANGGK